MISEFWEPFGTSSLREPSTLTRERGIGFPNTFRESSRDTKHFHPMEWLPDHWERDSAFDTEPSTIFSRYVDRLSVLLGDIGAADGTSHAFRYSRVMGCEEYIIVGPCYRRKGVTQVSLWVRRRSIA